MKKKRLLEKIEIYHAGHQGLEVHGKISLASMGAVLLCAGHEGKRSALPHSRVMIHQPIGGAQGQASDIEITAREILKLKDELYQIIAKHSKQKIDKVNKDSDRDYWMKAEEAKSYGMVDEVLGLAK